MIDTPDRQGVKIMLQLINQLIERFLKRRSGRRIVIDEAAYEAIRREHLEKGAFWGLHHL